MEVDERMRLSAERLKKVMKDNGLTQAALAEKIGVEPNMISMICRCKRALTTKRAKMIVDALPHRRYVIGWLLGIDTIESVPEKQRMEAILLPIAKQAVQNDQRRNALTDGFLSLGFSCDLLFKSEGTDVAVMTTDEQLLATISIQQFMELESAVQAFFHFTIDQIIKHSGEVSESG